MENMEPVAWITEHPRADQVRDIGFDKPDETISCFGDKYTCFPLYSAEQLATMQAKLEQALAESGLLLELLVSLREYVDPPPESNCSCHISPPCSDCVDELLRMAAELRAEG